MPIDLEALARELGVDFAGTTTPAAPAAPADPPEEGEKSLPEAKKDCRHPTPAPRRQVPASAGNGGGGQEDRRRLPAFAGVLPAPHAGKRSCDGDGHKPPLEDGLPALPAGMGTPAGVAPTPPPVELVGGRADFIHTWQTRLNTAREIRARWFATPPKPLPPEVLKRAGAVPEIHGLQGCWNMAGNRLPPEELKALLDPFAQEVA